MADKQLARSEASEFGALPDDDPLSELARIVGYDNRPAVQQLQELEKHRESVRFDALPDLEAELMREFDAYDDPAPAVAPPVVAEPEVAVVVPVSPEAEWHQEEVAPEPVAVATAEIPVPSTEVEPAVSGGYFDAAALRDGANYIESFQSDSQAEAPVREEIADRDPVFSEIDLERELELSIGYDHEIARPAEREEHPSVAAQEPADDPAAHMIAAAPVDVDPIEAEPVSLQPVAPEPARPQPAVPADEGIDALLSDIERFPVPEAQPVKAVSPEIARKSNYPFTPTFSRATPVASGGTHTQKAFATPLVVGTLASASTATVPPVVEAAPQPAETPAPVVAEQAVPVQTQAEPDFDLDTFELDLSDIDLDLDPPAPAATVAPAAPAAEPVQERPVVADAPEPAVPVYVQPAYETTAYVPDVAFEEELEEEAESVLPFDPAMISENEEHVTAIADLNVPQLPVVEQEKPVVQQPDYDLDIDAEMAQLFGRTDAPQPVMAGLDRSASGNVAAAPAGNAMAKPGVPDDFDEFERAMEEDFRLSLSQRREADTASQPLGGNYTPEFTDEQEARPGMRRWALLAATVAGIAILGGVGAYAWMGSGNSLTASGDPKIILADKTPVKMVPVEKGGKTVPNQDKAVYDRVAGAQDQVPQQGTLVSSTEEPIDVVQRTLTPETLPLEGRDDEGLTAIDDEGSDRLMPDTPETDTAAAAEDRNPALSPRKVRTMIVKPDGTLVARDEPAAPAQTAEAGAAPTQPTLAQPGEAPQEAASLDTLRAQEPASAAEPPSALAQAANASVDEVSPVRTVKTTAVVNDKPAPAPQAKPVEQAAIATTAKAVSQTTEKPAAEAVAAVEAKPLQTASIAPGTYVVQIASLPSEAEAQKSYSTLSGKYAVIAGKGVDIKKADIAGKGTYYRVRIPAGTRDEANALCTRYKSAGGSCLVTR